MKINKHSLKHSYTYIQTVLSYCWGYWQSVPLTWSRCCWSLKHSTNGTFGCLPGCTFVLACGEILLKNGVGSEGEQAATNQLSTVDQAAHQKNLHPSCLILYKYLQYFVCWTKRSSDLVVI